jgi:hypothetical protein
MTAPYVPTLPPISPTESTFIRDRSTAATAIASAKDPFLAW